MIKAITRVPLALVTPQGDRTEGAAVGVLASELDQLEQMLAAQREENQCLRDAILNIDAKAVALAATRDDWTAVGYYLPIGPLHRALGMVGHSAVKDHDVMPPEWFVRLLKRAVERTEATRISAELEAEQSIIRDLLVAVCRRDGISVCEYDPDDPSKEAPNFELAARLQIGDVFGLRPGGE